MKIFFDAMTPDAPGGGVNIAELLAKQGVKTDSDVTVEVPSVNIGSDQPEDKPQATPEVKPEPAPAPVETTSEPAPPAPPQPEPPKVEPAPQPAAVAEPPKPVEVDWREVLKKQPESEVMKVMGLDDKMINFLSRWKAGEDLKDYFEAIATDYSKMSAEEVMRRHYQREFGDISREDFEELFRMKVIEQYKLDPDLFDEKDVRRGKLLLNVEADKIRQQFIQRQQELLLSKPPVPQPSTQELEAQAQEQAAQAEREKAVADYRGAIEKDVFTQDLLKNRLMPIGAGEDAFNYEVTQPQALLDVIFDPQKWASSLYDANGAPNVRKHMLLAAIATDDAGFLDNYAKHHQRIGAKKAIEPIENASTTTGTPAAGNDLPSDPAAALAKAGVITTGW